MRMVRLSSGAARHRRTFASLEAAGTNCGPDQAGNTACVVRVPACEILPGSRPPRWSSPAVGDSLTVAQTAILAATCLAGLGGVLGVLYQVHADHDRRCKQATIDFYTSTIEVRRQLRHRLPPDRDTHGVRAALESVASSDVHELAEEGRTLLAAVQEYLSYHETLAVGVLNGVFNERIVRDLAESRIKAVISSYGPFIQARREKWANPHLFVALEQLGRRWGGYLGTAEAAEAQGPGEEEE